MFSKILNQLPVEFGNAGAVNTQGTGWFVGYSDWSKHPPHDLRHMAENLSCSGLCLKWYSHAAGDPNGQDKPVSTGRTMSILVGGDSRFRIDFSRSPYFPLTDTISHTLARTGDYVIWGPGVFHRAFGIEAATILTIRWQDSEPV